MPDTDVTGAMSGIVTAPFAPFSASGLNPHFAADAKLSADLSNLITTATLMNKNYSFAVVDLTDDPKNPDFGLSSPAYAGVNDTSYGTIASMAKLLTLYGAYELRYDLRQYLRQAAANSPIQSIEALAQVIRTIYRQEWRAAEKNQDIPLIEDMFKMGSGQLDFVRSDASDSDLNNVNVNTGTKKSPGPRFTRTYKKLRFGNGAQIAQELTLNPFFDQLRLVTGWSDDVSAAIVIESLGFPYLWQLARNSGLFKRKWSAIGSNGVSGKGGLFLARDYNGSGWDSQISNWGRSSQDTPTHTGGTRAPFHGGTARSVATLMTALAQDRLVGDGLTDFDPDAHNEMRELLRHDSNFDALPDRSEGSPIGEGIAGAMPPTWNVNQTAWQQGMKPPTNLAVSKVGWISGTHLSNAVLVRVTRTTGPQIAAVLVGINRADDSDKPLFNFGAGMVKLLDNRHPA